MISLGAKFADYGLTGGFAVCGQAALLSWLAPGTTRSIIECVTKALATFFQDLPPGLVTPVSAFLTAVAIISIFFLGLVLELIGSIAVLVEVYVFRSHLKLHRPWLSELLANYGSATVKDVDRIVSEFGQTTGTGKEWRGAWRGIAFWSRSSRQKIAQAWRRATRRFRLLRPFSRIQALLLSYVLAADSAPRLDLLRDHLQLCRVSRAVSAVLFVCSLEVFVGFYRRIFTRPEPSWSLMFGSLCLALALMGLSRFLTQKAYGRFCDSLFAHVLVLSHKLKNEARVRMPDQAAV